MNYFFDILDNPVWGRIAEIGGAIVVLGTAIGWFYNKYIVAQEKKIKELEEELEQCKQQLQAANIYLAEMSTILKMTLKLLEKETPSEIIKDVFTPKN